jgi:CDP-diacylglycerol--glycerol-3-phosphate 3-phosphatidyltransferase
MKHLPNALTIGRIVLTPVFLVLFLSGTFGAQLAALIIFIVGAISDWLDGAVARKYGVGSRLGQFLDPLADKVLVLGAFFALMFLQADAEGRVVPEFWWWIPIGFIALRDAAVTGLRSWADRRGTPVQTRYAAKLKTAVQLTFLILIQVLLVAARLVTFEGWPADVGAAAAWLLYSPFPDVLLLITAVLTVWTGALYFTGLQRRPAAVPRQAGAPGEPRSGAAQPPAGPASPSSESASSAQAPRP